MYSYCYNIQASPLTPKRLHIFFTIILANVGKSLQVYKKTYTISIEEYILHNLAENLGLFAIKIFTLAKIGRFDHKT